MLTGFVYHIQVKKQKKLPLWRQEVVFLVIKYRCSADALLHLG